jgi:hypothetical protein
MLFEYKLSAPREDFINITTQERYMKKKSLLIYTGNTIVKERTV